MLANRVQRCDRWARPCRAYLAIIRPGAAAAAQFAGLQDRVLALEPSLLAVPGPALHASLAWLLPVHQEFGQPKDELWRRHGEDWVAELAAAAAATPRFRLRFASLAATDTAIIAVAGEPNPLTALRGALVPRLQLPGPASVGGLAHITLFRYAGPLARPARLLAFLADPGFSAEVGVGELLVVRERVFPALEADVLARLPLAAGR